MIIHYSHDRCTTAFPALTREARARSESLTPHPLGQPTNEKVEARSAHLDDILLIAEALC